MFLRDDGSYGADLILLSALSKKKTMNMGGIGVVTGAPISSGDPVGIDGSGGSEDRRGADRVFAAMSLRAKP